MNRRDVLKAGAASAALTAAGFITSVRAFADDDAAGYPSKPISLIVPYPPGGIADARARLQADYLGASLKQSTVVDNVPGAGGILGVRRLIAAAPDGYTLMSSTSSTMTVVPLLNKSANFDPKKDLVPVCQMFVEPAAVVVAKDSRFKSLQDIIDEAKRRPGELTYASPGINSLYHLCGEAIQQLAGIKLKHVPYSGAAQYVIDMMGGRIDLASSTLGTYMQNQDKLRGIILAMPVRARQAPDIPTAAEAGLKGLDIPAGSGVFAPARTPPAVIDKIAAVYRKMIVDPAMAERIQRLGLETGFRSSEEFKADLAAQYSAIGELIKTAGLKPAG